MYSTPVYYILYSMMLIVCFTNERTTRIITCVRIILCEFELLLESTYIGNEIAVTVCRYGNKPVMLSL